MQTRRQILLGGAAVSLAACSGRDFPTRAYTGPEVTRIHVDKPARKLMLVHQDRALKQYDIGLGFSPEGHKQFEGDGRTPEGRYIIDRRNPNSSYLLSIGLSYPNERDIAFARAAGRSPGGDIFIHGLGTVRPDRRDWTWGCIAVTNDAIKEIYWMVANGTPIDIVG